MTSRGHQLLDDLITYLMTSRWFGVHLDDLPHHLMTSRGHQLLDDLMTYLMTSRGHQLLHVLMT